MFDHQRFAFLAILLLGCLLHPDIASASPSITLSEKSGPPTSRILVSGRGFEPNVGVNIYFDTKDKALVVTNAKGAFHDAAIYTPRSAYPGKHWITALERNNDKGAQEAFLVETDWVDFHFDADGSRLNPYENVLSAGTVGNLQPRWSYSITQISSSPAVSDGIVYAATDYSGFFALDAKTGTEVWEHDIGDHVFSSPAVAKGMVYITSLDHNIYALNAKTGSKVWQYTTGYNVDSSPTVADGVVYFGSDDLHVYALNAKTGAELWAFYTEQPVESSPAVVNGTVYVSSDATLYALNAKTGAPLWSYTPTCCSFESAPVEADGIVYADQWDNGTIYAVNAADGTFLWSYRTGGTLESSPAVAYGIVYVGSYDGNLYALNAKSGSLLWTFNTGSYIRSSSPTVANGVVYIGSSSGYLYALDAKTGVQLWDYPAGDLSLSTAVVTDGVVYTGSWDSAFQAFSLAR